SELLAAICNALDVPLSEILSEVSDAVALEEAAVLLRLKPVDLTSAKLPGRSGVPGADGEVVASAA
ncbi:MAG: hypothetical protein QOK15_2417, partial [Nocardioidaceae bacterium]|nr:hypothetical protein [Nocardioidaceae bacterium]